MTDHIYVSCRQCAACHCHDCVMQEREVKRQAIQDLVNERDRLRKALRFYADERHWTTEITVPDGSYPGRRLPAPGAKEVGNESTRYWISAIDQDFGRRAKEALGDKST